MPRQARIDYPGALHHVIVRGIEGKDIFKGYYNKQELYTRLKKRGIKAACKFMHGAL